MTKEIKLTQGMVAIVDDEWFDYLNQFKWQATKMKNGKWYASRVVKMHREIAGVIAIQPTKVDVDHRNQNGLDNRVENLRVGTRSQNMSNTKKYSTNTSGYKGVMWSKRQSKWIAQIKYHGKLFHLGVFDNKIDAARAYDAAATDKFGEFAGLNFPA
jgi:AP2 domain.